MPREPETGPPPPSVPASGFSSPIPLSTLAYIVAASLAGGVLSIVAAAGTLTLHPSWISKLVSFAVGALLGAVFIELLPHALESGSAERVMITVLVGLLVFFLLEKLVLWRHSHGEEEHAAPPAREAANAAHASDDAHGHRHARVAGHGEDGGRSGLMILIGNSVHNFCDGIVIAASFLAGTALGVTATLAIVSHAIPQQVGDFAILLHSGYPRRRAFAFNLATGAATIVGALAGYFALADMQQALSTVLAIAAASLLYVAVADLIPSLHRRAEPVETATHLALIGLGIGIIAVVARLSPALNVTHDRVATSVSTTHASATRLAIDDEFRHALRRRRAVRFAGADGVERVIPGTLRSAVVGRAIRVGVGWRSGAGRSYRTAHDRASCAGRPSFCRPRVERATLLCAGEAALPPQRRIPRGAGFDRTFAAA